MLVGYMRVSKADGSQTTNLQRDALLAEGVDPEALYEDRASGKKEDRPELAACLKSLRHGDTLVVWKLTSTPPGCPRDVGTSGTPQARDGPPSCPRPCPRTEPPGRRPQLGAHPAAGSWSAIRRPSRRACSRPARGASHLSLIRPFT